MCASKGKAGHACESGKTQNKKTSFYAFYRDLAYKPSEYTSKPIFATDGASPSTVSDAAISMSFFLQVLVARQCGTGTVGVVP